MALKLGLALAFNKPEEYAQLAQAAEQNGFSAVTLADHLIYPQQFSVPYPYTEDGVPRFGEMDPFPDPWIAVAGMAAVTRTLEFYTSVFVLPSRNPTHVAKTLATAAVFSNNRVTLGVGMGWMPEEFAISGESFARRGKRADEMLDVIQALWSGEQVEYHGEFYDFEPVRMLPAPSKKIPIWVGGFSEPAMKRAAKHDGWIADSHTLDELELLCKKVDHYRELNGTLDKPFSKASFACMDARGVEGFRRMEAMGISMVSTMPWLAYGEGFNIPLERKLDAIKRFADDIIAKL